MKNTPNQEPANHNNNKLRLRRLAMAATLVGLAAVGTVVSRNAPDESMPSQRPTPATELAPVEQSEKQRPIGSAVEVEATETTSTTIEQATPTPDTQVVESVPLPPVSVAEAEQPDLPSASPETSVVEYIDVGADPAADAVVASDGVAPSMPDTTVDVSEVPVSTEPIVATSDAPVPNGTVGVDAVVSSAPEVRPEEPLAIVDIGTPPPPPGKVEEPQPRPEF